MCLNCSFVRLYLLFCYLLCIFYCKVSYNRHKQYATPVTKLCRGSQILQRYHMTLTYEGSSILRRMCTRCEVLGFILYYLFTPEISRGAWSFGSGQVHSPTFMVIFYPKASDGHIQLMYEIWTAFQRYEGIPNLKIGHLGVLCHPLASNCSDPSSKFKDRSRDSGHAPLWLLNIKDCRILIQDYTDKVISRNAWLDCFACNKVRSIGDEEV